MPISKIVSGKKYWFYDKYYTKEEALKKALIMKAKAKGEGRKIRTYIEEVEDFDLFILPTTFYYLWINGN